MEKNMTVNLIGITKPTAYSECFDAAGLVAYAARVSNPANQSNSETAPKLIKYLINNNHWSPFEMVHIVMEIKTTRDISRQILRHRSFSFQEFSQRYAVSENFISNREARLQDTKNRQNSIENEDRRLQEQWNMHQKTIIDHSKMVYEWALNMGIAKEQARSILPEGLTETTLYMSGTLRSWIHYIDLRTDNGTQKEHRLIAKTCKDIVVTHFPMLEEYFNSERDA
jgi:thymidylate synthase (FAD)